MQLEKIISQQNATIRQVAANQKQILALMNRMRAQKGLGELEQSPEDINWRVFWTFVKKSLDLQPKKPLDVLLREMVEIGLLNPQTVVPVAAKPFKITTRRTPLPGSLAPETGTGTGTGEETGETGTGTGTGEETGTGEPVPPGPGQPGNGDPQL